MATNFDFEYARAMTKYENAKTTDEKIAALEEMKSTAPSHKGAEKLRLDISKKLSKLKDKQEKEAQRTSGSKAMTVKKEGGAQILLLGLPNSGKSTLLSKITNATPEIAPYEFTTVEPEIGAMDYKGAKIQVVEIPALIEDTYKGKARGREKLALIRNSDFLIFTFIGSYDAVISQYDIMQNELSRAGININKKKPAVTVKKTGILGIDFINEKYLQSDRKLVEHMLKSRGIMSALITLEEPSDVYKIEEAIDNSLSYKNAIGIWIYGDKNLSYQNLDIYSDNLDNISSLKDLIYSKLDLIMVYTRKPGERDEDNIPVVLKKGSTIMDLCSILHNDFAERFNFARVWGSSKFPGQAVSKDFILSESDIIEIVLRK